MTQAVTETRIIVNASQKGGVGKTSTTVNLGAQLALWGARVAIIDFDPQAQVAPALGCDETEYKNSIGAALGMFNMGHPVDLSLFLQDQSELVKDAGGSGELHFIGTSVYAMDQLSDWVAGSRRHVDTQLAATTSLRRFIKSYLADFDYVIIDTLPATNQLAGLALAAADWVIGLLAAEYQTLSGIISLYDQVQMVPESTAGQCRPVYLGTLFNKVPTKETAQDRNLRTALGAQTRGELRNSALSETASTGPVGSGEEPDAATVPAQADPDERQFGVFRTSIGMSELISGAFAEGQPAVLLHPGRALAEQYGEFATEVYERIESHEARLTGAAR